MRSSDPPPLVEGQPKILVVDDVEDGRFILRAMLGRAGYENVQLAASADDVFLAFKRGTKTSPSGIDLVLLDISMPRVDGLEVLRWMKAEEALKHLPVIMVTAHTEEEMLARAFEGGANDYLAKPVRAVELIARVRSAMELKREMDRRRARETELVEVTRWLEEANSSLRHLTVLDPLTGIANRRHFDATLATEHRRALREETPLSILMVDIDHFKEFNDTHGHPAGDDCLRRVARALETAVGRPTDFVARYGGEEFALILAQTPEAGARKIAEEIRAAVAALRISCAGGRVAQVSISVGVSTSKPPHRGDAVDLVAAADRALYVAKDAGRDRVSVLPPKPRAVTLPPPRTRTSAPMTPTRWASGSLPRFLANRRRDVRVLGDAITRLDFDTALRVGQNLRAIGVAYGMTGMVAIGASIAEAARSTDADALKAGRKTLVAALKVLQEPD